MGLGWDQIVGRPLQRHEFIAIDVATPEPTDAAVPKCIGYAAASAIAVVILYDTATITTVGL